MTNTEQKPEMTPEELMKKWEVFLPTSYDYQQKFLSDLRSVIHGETSELLKQRDELLEAVKVELEIIKSLIASKRIVNLDESIAYYEKLITKAEER